MDTWRRREKSAPKLDIHKLYRHFLKETTWTSWQSRCCIEWTNIWSWTQPMVTFLEAKRVVWEDTIAVIRPPRRLPSQTDRDHSVKRWSPPLPVIFTTMYSRPSYRQAAELSLSHEHYSLLLYSSPPKPNRSGGSMLWVLYCGSMLSSIEHNISLSTRLRHNLQSSKTLATIYPHPCWVIERNSWSSTLFIHSTKHVIVTPSAMMDTSAAQQTSTLEGAAQDLYVARQSYVCEQVRRERVRGHAFRLGFLSIRSHFRKPACLVIQDKIFKALQHKGYYHCHPIVLINVVMHI